MQQFTVARFANFDSFAIAELPYKDHEQAMVIILPKKHDGLPAVEKKLTAENLHAWLMKLAMHEIDLKLPKFKVTSEFSLRDVLIKMGMKDAFMHGKSDFSGMATGENLSISAVIHKAFVDVNEAGTEAAAATAVIVRGDSAPPRYPAATFHVDHPFVFLIRDQRTGSILFQGRVVDPK